MLPDRAHAAHRFAIYYAAPPGSPLDRFGTEWLGRDHQSGRLLPQPEVPGFAPGRLQRLTAAPRRYGFHATLKSPFRLAPGRTAAELHAAAEAFAGTQETFELAPLTIADLKGFLAFVPGGDAGPLNALAEACVRAFEAHRAPLNEAEMARRLTGLLTTRQRRQLDAFGYPYIFDDYDFHMTLTQRLEPADKARLLPYLRQRAASLERLPLLVDAIAIYEEATPGAPFIMTGRYKLRPPTAPEASR